jgi:hypothetical protein
MARYGTFDFRVLDEDADPVVEVVGEVDIAVPLELERFLLGWSKPGDSTSWWTSPA